MKPYLFLQSPIDIDVAQPIASYPARNQRVVCFTKVGTVIIDDHETRQQRHQ